MGKSAKIMNLAQDHTGMRNARDRFGNQGDIAADRQKAQDALARYILHHDVGGMA